METGLKKGDKLICIIETDFVFKNYIYTFKTYDINSHSPSYYIFLEEKETKGPWWTERFKKIGPVLTYILDKT